MTKETIIKAFKRLSDLLGEQEKQAEVYVVGGGAMILAYNARTTTKDIDAIFTNKEIIYKISKQVADEMELDDYWINDAAKSFIPAKKDENPIPIIDEKNLKVMAASEEYMLGMKLLASRMEDKPDIEFLLDRLNIKSAEEALYIIRDLYPDKLIQPKTKYVICIRRNIFAKNRKRNPRTRRLFQRLAEQARQRQGRLGQVVGLWFFPIKKPA